MTKLDLNKTGLVLGVFIAIMHAVWALWIAVSKDSLQGLLNWIFELHSLEPYWIITSFNLMNAVLLVIVTFVCGYVFGAVFAALWNWLLKGKK